MSIVIPPITDMNSSAHYTMEYHSPSHSITSAESFDSSYSYCHTEEHKSNSYSNMLSDEEIDIAELVSSMPDNYYDDDTFFLPKMKKTDEYGGASSVLANNDFDPESDFGLIRFGTSLSWAGANMV